MEIERSTVSILILTDWQIIYPLSLPKFTKFGSGLEISDDSLRNRHFSLQLNYYPKFKHDPHNTWYMFLFAGLEGDRQIACRILGNAIEPPALVMRKLMVWTFPGKAVNQVAIAIRDSGNSKPTVVTGMGLAVILGI